MFDSGIRLAKVVRAYPDGNSVDLVMFDDNSPVSNVQVMCGQVSGRSGPIGMIDPTAPPDGEWGNQDSGNEDMTAFVAFMRGEPFVLGFLKSQINQLSFGDKNKMGYRFPSDVYVVCDSAGNFELSHPGGAYLRIATTPEHESLTGKDADKKWKRDRNTGAQCHIHIEQSGGKASVDIDPAGNITVTSMANISVEADGNIALKADGNIDIEAGGNFSVTAARVDLN